MGYLESDKKQELFANYGKSNTDTGSAESQIALFSYRISHLTEHMKRSVRCSAWRVSAAVCLTI